MPKALCRTTNARRSMVEYMGIGHSGSDIVVPKQFLHSSNVIPGFKEMCRKGYQEMISD
jgi:hypothetical protein